MKITILLSLLLTLAITACREELKTNYISAVTPKDSVMSAQFEAADEKIVYFLDQLDNTHTSLKVRKQIICIDYPDIYQDEYVPSLLKLSPDNTKEQLDHDLKLALDYYKNKDNVECN